MTCCASSLRLQHGAGAKITYAPGKGFSFSDLTPLLRIWQGDGNADSPLLEVGLTETPKGSRFVIADGAMLLELTASDVGDLPASDDLFFDITLTDVSGFINPFLGGACVVDPDGSRGPSAASGSVMVALNGLQVPVVIQGGSLGPAMATAVADLNAAVSQAKEYAAETEQAKQEVLIAAEGKVDKSANGSDFDSPSAVRANIGAASADDLTDVADDVATRLSKTADLSDLADKEAANRTLGTFATRALAVAANIPAVLTSITLRGYYEACDGGGAVYRRIADEPSHPGKLQSADGQWWEIAEKVIDPRMMGLKVGVGQGDQQPAIMDAIAAAIGVGHRNVQMPPAADGNHIEIGQTITVLDRVNIWADGYRACILQKIEDVIGLVVGPNVAARDSIIGPFMIRGRQDDGDLRDGIFNPDENSPGAIFYEKGYYDVHATLNGGPNWQGDPEYAAFMETVAPGKTIVPVMHSAGGSECFQIGLIQSIRGSEGKNATSLNGTVLRGKVNYGYGDGVFTGWEVGTEDSTYQINEGRRNINGVVIALEDGKNLVNGRVVNWTRGFKPKSIDIDIVEGNDCISAVRFDDDYIEARIGYLAGGQDYSFEFGPNAAFCVARTLHDNGTALFDAATSESNVAYQGTTEYKKSAASLTRRNKGYDHIEGGIRVGTSTSTALLKSFDAKRSQTSLVWGNAGSALTPTTNQHNFQIVQSKVDLWFNMVWTRSGDYTNALRLSSLPRPSASWQIESSALPADLPVGRAVAITPAGIEYLTIVTDGADRLAFWFDTVPGDPVIVNDLVADGAQLRLTGSASYPIREV